MISVKITADIISAVIFFIFVHIDYQGLYRRVMNNMNKNVENRCIELGEYISKSKATVRQTAEVFGVSKSTVHIDVTKRLSQIAPNLANEVNAVLQENKAQRHIRGGEATKEKYLKNQNAKNN